MIDSRGFRQVDLVPGVHPQHDAVPGSRQAPPASRRVRILGSLRNIESGWLPTIVTLAILLAIPAVSPASTPLMTSALVFLFMAYAWNLVGGFLGEMSFAHMIFWAIGGYGLVLADNAGLLLGPVVIGLMLLAAVAGAGVAGLIRAVRLEGLLPVSIFTLVLGQIAYTWVSGTESLGRTEGLIVNSLPAVGMYPLFLLLGLLVVVAAVTNVALANARRGRQWLAIRDDAVGAQVAGINVSRQRYAAYVLSAALFAAGGAYQAYYSGSAAPENMLGMSTLIFVLLAVFVGGPGTAMGPLLGSVIIFGVQAAALHTSDSPDVSLWAQLLAFGSAVLLLRFVTPRLHGFDLATALLRRLSRQESGKNGEAKALRTVADATLLVDAAVPRSRHEERREQESLPLAVCDIHKSFGALKVLQGVSFTIEPGEVVGIVGPNGAGKSTLCNIISGIERPTAGDMMLAEHPLADVPVHDRSSHGMGRSFQTPRLFPSLSLTENLSLGRRQMSDSEAELTLRSMGIFASHRRRGDDSQFFARRLTEVLKAAIQGTEVLVLDEPLAGLTPVEQQVVLLLARRAAENGARVAIVEHLIPVLAPAVDRIVVLDGGRIVADGSPSVVLLQHEVVEAYLGKPHRVEEE